MSTKVSDLSYQAQQVIESMKSQLLIVLINRLGGTVSIPVEEIDATGKFNLAMQVVDQTFTFIVQEKGDAP